MASVTTIISGVRKRKDDDDDGDEDGDDEEEKKPSGGGVRLVPRAERRRDHRGMARETTIISGDRKRKATDDFV